MSVSHAIEQMELRTASRKAREWWQKTICWFGEADLSDDYFAGEMFLRGGPDGGLLVIRAHEVRTFLSPLMGTAATRDLEYVRGLLVRQKRAWISEQPKTPRKPRAKKAEAETGCTYGSVRAVMLAFEDRRCFVVPIDVLCEEAKCSRAFVLGLTTMGLLTLEPGDKVWLSDEGVK